MDGRARTTLRHASTQVRQRDSSGHSLWVLAAAALFCVLGWIFAVSAHADTT